MRDFTAQHSWRITSVTDFSHQFLLTDKGNYFRVKDKSWNILGNNILCFHLHIENFSSHTIYWPKESNFGLVKGLDDVRFLKY